MDMEVIELIDKKDLVKAIKFVAVNFKESEKSFYSSAGLQEAFVSLQGYDIFDTSELEKMVKSGLVKVFACFQGALMKAVSALEINSGKILFFSADTTSAGKEAKELLLESMVNERENAADKRLNILAFVGQEKSLVELGFVRINSSVFHFFDIKFIAMRYDYAQIDIER